MSAHLHGSGTVYQDGTMKKQRTLLVLSAAILVGGVGTALALQSKTEFTVARPIVQPKTVEQVAMRMLADEAAGITVDDKYLVQIAPWISAKPAEAMVKGALAVNLVNTYHLRNR